MSVWIVLSAIVVAVLIAWLGLTVLRAAPGVGMDLSPSPEPEDVDDPEVYRVSRVRTEFRPTRLGELRIPPALRRADGGGSTPRRRGGVVPPVVHTEYPVPGRFSRRSPQISGGCPHSEGERTFPIPVDGAVGNHTDVIPIRAAGISAKRVAATKPAPITPQRPIHSQCCCVLPAGRKSA